MIVARRLIWNWVRNAHERLISAREELRCYLLLLCVSDWMRKTQMYLRDVRYMNWRDHVGWWRHEGKIQMKSLRCGGCIGFEVRASRETHTYYKPWKSPLEHLPMCRWHQWELIVLVKVQERRQEFCTLLWTFRIQISYNCTKVVKVESRLQTYTILIWWILSYQYEFHFVAFPSFSLLNWYSSSSDDNSTAKFRQNSI